MFPDEEQSVPTIALGYFFGMFLGFLKKTKTRCSNSYSFERQCEKKDCDSF